MRLKMKKKDELILFIIAFIIIFFSILAKPINNLDEIWNYNFARNIADGLIPYKDFNMLQMPLLPIISGIILKYTFNEIIITRILAGFLCATIMLLVYKILKILDVKKELAVLITGIITLLMLEYYCLDYNFATLLIVLLIIYNEIKFYKRDKNIIKANIKQDILLGIMAGIAILLKQNTGILVIIAMLANKLFFIKNKQDLKEYLKSFLFRLMPILILISLMIIYLIYNNCFNDFVNYSIKGVSEFSNYIPYKKLLKLDITGLFALLVPITFGIVIYKIIIKRDKDKALYFLLIYGLAMFVVAFPISDKIHFYIGAIPTIVLMSYLLSSKITNIIENKMYRFCFYYVKATIYVSLLAYVIINSGTYLVNKHNYSDLAHYQYIIVDEKLEENIEKVDTFILTSKDDVKILDASAALYMIPIDKYNKNYDLLLKGNLGKDGEEKIIAEIESSKDVKYLILQDKYHKNWQTPLQVINNVKENKNKTGTIGDFDIYE